MFLEQINAAKVDGVVHICKYSVFVGSDIWRCEICNKIYNYGEEIRLTRWKEYISSLELQENAGEFMNKYVVVTGDMRTDEEVEEIKKSLWEKIKRLLK